MAKHIVPAGDAPNQEAVDLYLSVFDTESVDRRLETLRQHGVGNGPDTKARMLAMRSLTWATAAEVGLHALATRRDPTTLSTVDATIAALRVARGLSEDTRSIANPVIDELLAAAEALIVSLPHPAGTAIRTLVPQLRAYREQLAEQHYDYCAYLAALPLHSIGVTGLMLREQHLVEPIVEDAVHRLAVSLGGLYQLTTDLDAGRQSLATAINQHMLVNAMSIPTSRERIVNGIVLNSRALMDSLGPVREHYTDSPLLDEILQRANLTLRDSAILLKRERDRWGLS